MRLRGDKPKKKAKGATVGMVKTPREFRDDDGSNPNALLYGDDENAMVRGDMEDDPIDGDPRNVLRMRQIINALIASRLSDEGLPSSVVASHNYGTLENGGAMGSMYNFDRMRPVLSPLEAAARKAAGVPAVNRSSSLNIPEAMAAAVTESTRRYGSAPPNVVGAFCGHGEVGCDTPQGRYWAEQMQTVADTSRGGQGVNAFVPLGRNVHMSPSEPLGQIAGGGVRMFRPHAAPVDTMFTGETPYLQLIKALSEKAGREQAR